MGLQEWLLIIFLALNLLVWPFVIAGNLKSRRLKERIAEKRGELLAYQEMLQKSGER